MTWRIDCIPNDDSNHLEAVEFDSDHYESVRKIMMMLVYCGYVKAARCVDDCDNVYEYFIPDAIRADKIKIMKNTHHYGKKIN